MTKTNKESEVLSFKIKIKLSFQLKVFLLQNAQNNRCQFNDKKIEKALHVRHI